MTLLPTVVARRWVSVWWWMPAVAGVAALLARPWLLPVATAVEWRVAFFVALGAVGVAAPWVRRAPPASWPVCVGVAAIGALAFTIGRAVSDVPALWGGIAVAVALNALAAVAEEAFFRRYLYALVEERWAATAAVIVTAGAFAVVHVTVWGLWVLPLDLAAGLVLSWQRAATGRWSVPAATHVVANTLALL